MDSARILQSSLLSEENQRKELRTDLSILSTTPCKIKKPTYERLSLRSMDEDVMTFMVKQMGRRKRGCKERRT